MSMFAKFYPTEAAAWAACEEWSRSVRKDWIVSDIVEVHRNAESEALCGPLSCRVAVAPISRPSTPDVPARQLIVKANGEFSRNGEPYRGIDRAEFRVVFPA
jgi:hypothetical protein